MLAKIENIPEWLKDDAERNLGTLWQVVKAYRANLRQGTVGVKTRAMVRSTGKKPYGQKHTGRARRGSFVSPLHVGGGVAHGPKARDYREAISKKMGALAFRIALAKKILSGSVYSGEVNAETGRTKDAAASLRGVYESVGKTLVCLPEQNELAGRALRNIEGILLRSPAQITALDLVTARRVVLAKGALEKLEQRVKQQRAMKKK